ncbi:hypothetical protein [Nonomuraea roseola]|uniref:Uncharacterized protein n=1 Tax=Nonomuraea roseola TaxID=46179 RepID=A0ABV5Q4D6_9ACTN
MSHDTLCELVDARIERARSKAELAVTAAGETCERSAVRAAEAERLAAATPGKADTRAMIEQARAHALAQGQELADALAAKGAALKAGAADAGN